MCNIVTCYCSTGILFSCFWRINKYPSHGAEGTLCDLQPFLNPSPMALSFLDRNNWTETSVAVLLEKLIVVQLVTNFPPLWNPVINNSVHMSSPMICILTQINPLHILPFCFLKIHFHDIRSAVPCPMCYHIFRPHTGALHHHRYANEGGAQCSTHVAVCSWQHPSQMASGRS